MDELAVEIVKLFMTKLKQYKLYRDAIHSYHNLGEHKWQELGLEYELKDVELPSEEMMKRVEDIFHKYGIRLK